MEEKYVKLKHVQELVDLIYRRDGYMDWMDEYDKLNKKVKKTVQWLERNAIEFSGNKPNGCKCEKCTCNHDYEDISEPYEFINNEITLRCKICGVIQCCSIDR